MWREWSDAQRRRATVWLLLGSVLAGARVARLTAAAQPRVQSPRLYVLDGGTLIYNNPETYNLTRREVKNTNMSVPCYLVVHPRGTLIFDTGLSDQFVGRPFNESPLGGRPDPPSTAYFVLVTRTVKDQLAAIGYTPDKIDFLALSHPHADHAGNANVFAASTWLVHRGDYDVMFKPGVQADNPMYRALRTSKTRVIEGDYDVFDDGTVVLKYTPGHTPGHQSLYVKLAGSGGVVLSGDLYHYPEERTLDRMPDGEKATETAASRAALEAFVQRVGAQLWIAHDITLYAKQKKPPAYYD
jgi:glyoxylase-like metal-dependent hydrolase (beta-lactamase superfamily II)